jgi:tRNA threonylcarbamoyl adenosine modification protein (Sua5/YciO/YrdC/YwlC family)
LSRRAAAAGAAVWRFGEALAPLRALLAQGGILAIPTESSYGLAAHPGSAAGIEAIYRIKGRERGKPLPVVIAGFDQLAGLGIAADLPILGPLSAFWPGPLTVVLPLGLGGGPGERGAAPVAAAAGSGSLAVRVPGHPRLLDLLSRLGHGLTATSANRSGGEPILDPRQAAELLAGELAMVVDGGLLPGGPPSTLVAPLAGGAAGAAAGGRGALPGSGGGVGALPGPGGSWAVELLRAGRLPVERLRERVTVIEAPPRGGRTGAGGPRSAAVGEAGAQDDGNRAGGSPVVETDAGVRS